MSHLKWLKWLILHFVCRSGGAFPSLPKLTDLSFSFMPDLTHIEAGAFSNLEALRHLHAQSNPHLSSIHEHAFSRPGKDNKYHELWPPLTSVRWSIPSICDAQTTNWFHIFIHRAAHSVQQQFDSIAARFARTLGWSWRDRFTLQ